MSQDFFVTYLLDRSLAKGAKKLLRANSSLFEYPDEGANLNLAM